MISYRIDMLREPVVESRKSVAEIMFACPLADAKERGTIQEIVKGYAARWDYKGCELYSAELEMYYRQIRSVERWEPLEKQELSVSLRLTIRGGNEHFYDKKAIPLPLTVREQETVKQLFQKSLKV